MKKSKLNITLLLLFNLLFLQCCHGQKKVTNSDAPLKLVTTISLPGVNGRIDHLAYNGKKQLIYIAALGNNTVEVVDMRNKKVIHTIKGLAEPQGIIYVPESNTIFVANGDNGVCNVFSANTYQPVTSLKLKGDADNVRHDVISKKIYVGYGGGGIAIIDALTFKQLGNVDLPGHPESFQLDRVSKKLFVNIPGARLIDVIDFNNHTIEAKWKLKEAASNFPMALDTAGHRLFIGCRHPSKLLVIDTGTGKTVTTLDIDNDADDIFYDAKSGRLYVSCGGGYIDVFRQTDQNKYETLPKTETQAGARTSLFVPELNSLFVAAPARMGNEARLIIYKLN